MLLQGGIQFSCCWRDWLCVLLHPCWRWVDYICVDSILGSLFWTIGPYVCLATSSKPLKATKKIISFMFQKDKVHRNKLVKEWKHCILKTAKHIRRKNTDKWKDIPCSCNRRLNIVKMLILPQTIHRLNAMPINIFMVFFLQKYKIQF